MQERKIDIGKKNKEWKGMKEWMKERKKNESEKEWKKEKVNKYKKERLT